MKNDIDEEKKFLVNEEMSDETLNNSFEQEVNINDLKLKEDVNSDVDNKIIENNLKTNIENDVSKNNLSNLENKSNDFEVNLSILGKEEMNDEFGYDIEETNDENQFEEKVDNENQDYAKSKIVKIKNKNDFGILFLVLALIGLIGFFFDDMILYIGLIICGVCFVSSVLTIKNSSLYSKIALTVSFIEIILYAVMLILGFRFINNYLNDKEADLFKNDAKTFISSAENKVGVNNNFRCNGKNVKRTKVYLNELDSVAKISPLNNKYDEKESYVLIETEEVDRHCVYRYYVFLKDDKYSLGTYAKPVLLENIDKTNVKKNSIYN